MTQQMEGFDSWRSNKETMPLTMAQLLNVTSSSHHKAAPPSQKETTNPLRKRQKLTEIRPKGSVVIVTQGDPMELRRKHHAQAQKQQRDRMKAALDRIAQIMEGAGVHQRPNGTKAELLETAVDIHPDPAGTHRGANREGVSARECDGVTELVES